MFGLAAVPAIIQFVGFLFMPDTPRWLIARGHYDKARTVLHRIYGTSFYIEHEVTNIVNSVQQSAENRKSYRCGNYSSIYAACFYYNIEKFAITLLY